MNEERKKALMSAYHAMTQTEAWKDLEQYAKSEQELSMKRMDCKAASDLVIGEVCEERGLRKGIAKILMYAEQNRDGVGVEF